MRIMQELLESYPVRGRVLDVGSLQVGNDPIGNYGMLLSPEVQYVGMDLTAGPNVGVLAEDPYHWPFADGEFDFVLSGQCLEHVHRPWEWIKEVYRVLKPGGRFYVVAPWRWHIHLCTDDCWRILPDGIQALFDYAGFRALEANISGDDMYAVGMRVEPPGGISWITAVSDDAVFESHLERSLEKHPADEVHVIRGCSDLGVAYNEALRTATKDVKCFVHQDVVILDTERLRRELLLRCAPHVGIVGITGTVNEFAVPWWNDPPNMVGSVVHSLGMVSGHQKSGPCAILDGLLLASRQPLHFEEGYQGFHMYDHDICRQMLTRHLQNYCLADGHQLVVHNSGFRQDAELARCIRSYCAKWSLPVPEDWIGRECQ